MLRKVLLHWGILQLVVLASERLRSSYEMARSNAISTSPPIDTTHSDQVVLLLRARHSSDAPLRSQRWQRDKCASALLVKLPCTRNTDFVSAARGRNWHNAFWQLCVAAASAPFLWRSLALAARTDKKLRTRSWSNSHALATLTWFGGPRGVASGPPFLGVAGWNLFIFLFSEMSKTQKYSFLLYYASTEYSRLL